MVVLCFKVTLKNKNNIEIKNLDKMKYNKDIIFHAKQKRKIKFFNE